MYTASNTHTLTSTGAPSTRASQCPDRDALTLLREGETASRQPLTVTQARLERRHTPAHTALPASALSPQQSSEARSAQVRSERSRQGAPPESTAAAGGATGYRRDAQTADALARTQSKLSWKMSRTWGEGALSGVAQKGHMLWKPLVPCGIITADQ